MKKIFWKTVGYVKGVIGVVRIIVVILAAIGGALGGLIGLLKIIDKAGGTISVKYREPDEEEINTTPIVDGVEIDEEA